MACSDWTLSWVGSVVLRGYEGDETNRFLPSKLKSIKIRDRAIASWENPSLWKVFLGLIKFELTLITIAHRLQTIVDYDKVLVMDDGTVKEFDSPRVLLRDKNSTLYSMAFRSGGIDMVKNLLSISG
jgi:hypothetical protein